MNLNPQILPPYVRLYVPVVLFGAILLTFGLWARNFYIDHQQERPGTVVIATAAHEVKSTPKISVQPKQLKVYAGGKGVKNNLKLPDPVVQDDSEQVIASSQVKADEHPHTITTTINTDTGESQTFVRTDPLPWFGLSSRGGIGIYGGIKNGNPAVRLEAKQDLFTVKALHFGVTASVDQPLNGPLGNDYFLGIGGEYRW